jgi:hypothetical protein
VRNRAAGAGPHQPGRGGPAASDDSLMESLMHMSVMGTRR